MIDRKPLLAALASVVGSPYLFGAKWELSDPKPSGPVDCSGLSRWFWAQGKIIIPEGSTNQHAESVKEAFILPGDLGFLENANHDGTHHVGVVYDQYFVIEARGIIRDAKECGSVIVTPKTWWTARPDFIGWYRPKAVSAIEGVNG